MQNHTSQAYPEKWSVPQLLAMSACWFGINLHWGAILIILLPYQIKKIDPMGQAYSLGVIFALGAVFALLVPLIIGAISDRCRSKWGRRRPFMVGGIALNVLGLLFMFKAGETRSLIFYAVGYLIIQIGSNICSGSYSPMIPDLVRKSQRGTASGFMAAMTQMGTLTGVVLCGFLVDSEKIGMVYALIIFALLVSTSITVLLIREKQVTTVPPPVKPIDFIKSLWINPKKHPDFAWVWITRFLVTMGRYTFQPFLLYYFRDVIKAENPVMATSIMLGIVLIAATITGVTGGMLSDKIGRKPVVYIANSLIAVCSILLIFAVSETYVFIIAIVFGLGLGAYDSVDWALGSDVIPDKENAAKHMAVWHISMTLPQSISPFIGGLILATIGAGVPLPDGAMQYTKLGYSVLFSLTAVQLALGAVLLRNVRGAR